MLYLELEFARQHMRNAEPAANGEHDERQADRHAALSASGGRHAMCAGVQLELKVGIEG